MSRSIRAGALLVPFLTLLAFAFSVTPVRAAGPLVDDAFSRTVTGGWGAASVGGAYAVYGSGASVANGTGRLTLGRGASTAAFAGSATLGSDTTTAVRSDARPAGGAAYAYLLARAGAGDEYRAKLRIAPDGSLAMGVSRSIDGRETPLRADLRLPFAAVDGRLVHLRLLVSGTAPTRLRARAWAAGTIQPTTWAIDVTDATAPLQDAGLVGVRGYLSGSATRSLTFHIDTLVATPVATSAPSAPACSRVVAPTGSDTATGRPGAPWRTLGKAAGVAAPGETICVRAGTYAGFTLYRSGLTGAPIRFVRYPGDARPVLDGVIGKRLDVVRLAGVHDVVISGFVIQNAQGSSYSGSGIRTDRNAHHIRIVDNVIRENQSYGVITHSSTNIAILRNDISGNAAGVYVTYAGQGTVVADNRIHHTDRMLRNTPTSVNAHDDSGGDAVALVKSTGRVVVERNRLWANRAWSYDYGWDGGAFSIFGASNVVIRDNRAWDNENVLETGTASGYACRGNRFVRNVANGGTAHREQGMYLRCGQDMLIAHNTIVDVDLFVLAIGYDSASFNGAIDGARVLNNIFVVDRQYKVYGFMSALPASVTIDRNLIWNSGGPLATVPGKGSTASLATLRSWTGRELNGVAAAPSFVARAARDYRLTTTSPAIDRGRLIVGYVAPYLGLAPDAGRFERR